MPENVRSNVVELSPQQVLGVVAREIFLELEQILKFVLFLLHVNVSVIKLFSGFPACRFFVCLFR